MIKFIDKDKFNMTAAVLVLIAAFGLSACNTVDGAGQDIEAAGDGISDAAKDVQDDM
tara:strand:- start:72 stop:242 length:171 start_codon:yes stop_codon:yes gene_type:complete